MPILEYKCENCSQIYEVLSSYIKSDEQEKEILSKLNCNCGNWSPKKVFSKTSFALKGSGWAKDNYHKGR